MLHASSGLSHPLFPTCRDLIAASAKCVLLSGYSGEIGSHRENNRSRDQVAGNRSGGVSRESKVGEIEVEGCRITGVLLLLLVEPHGHHLSNHQEYCHD